MSATAKALARKLVPYELLRRAKLYREFRTDRHLFRKWAGPDDYAALDAIKPHNLEMQLTKDYHRIEKGLALPQPRHPFGDSVLHRLDSLLPMAEAATPNARYIGHATSAREALGLWNSQDDEVVDSEIAPVGTDLTVLPDPEDFFKSRHSVRNYARRPVPRELLDMAVDLALQTPSVCNRQAWRIYLFDKRSLIEDALSYQNGNAGFRDSIPALALVTADRTMFAGANERNQPWIDGGLFAMTFAWALHGLGLGTCMLNMSQPNSRIRHLQRRFDIPESEAIMMFISIGYPAEGYRIARSPRRDLGAVRRWVED